MGPEVNARRGRPRIALRRRYAVGVAAFALGAIALAGCSSSGGGAASSGTAPTSAAGGGGASAGPQTLTIKQSSGGTSYLTDSTGRALYLFVPDPAGKSVCNGSCAVAWPPLTGTVTAGSGVTGALTTFQRSDGSAQAVINGHALYHYIGDSAPGQTNGEGSNANGGLWYLLSPAGDQVTSLSG